MKVLIITDNNFDDSELQYPYYRIIEKGFEVDIASTSKSEIHGKHYYKICANKTFDQISVSDYDGLILPGGQAPEKLRLIEDVLNITREFVIQNKPVAAICHGQQILISANLLKGKKATCYPGIKDDLINAGAIYIDNGLVKSESLITSRRPDDLPCFMKAFIESLTQHAIDHGALD